MDLFPKESSSKKADHSAESLHEPLASRMRPRSLDEYFGQSHILKEGSLLRRAIESDKLNSVIFYGPPGTGKTTLAMIISKETKSEFEAVNAVTGSVADLRKVLERAKTNAKALGRRTVLFVDEIHRFNKAQQDVLMPDVEKGNPVLIGATTYNPFFSIVPALLSRSMIFELKPLTSAEIKQVLKQAIADKARGLGQYKISLTEEAADFLAKVCEGDARKALSALEIGVLSSVKEAGDSLDFDLKIAEESIQKKAAVYDRDGDQHYDHASALIKSMRGSDPDAAIYYLAKMLEAGEDPRFLARRIVICAAEDVGNADPQALILANAALQAAEFIGMPEARIPLAQAVTYIAGAPKSNAAYMAIDEAIADVRSGRTLEVPDHLKDGHYKGAKRLGHGQGYKYAHDYEGHHVDQEYVKSDKIYYHPTKEGYEKKIRDRLKSLKPYRDS